MNVDAQDLAADTGDEFGDTTYLIPALQDTGV
jgi:hypothetical protein